MFLSNLWNRLIQFTSRKKPKFFHGVDITRYEYLGSTRISYTDPVSKIEHLHANLFYFVAKNDPTMMDRKYSIVYSKNDSYSKNALRNHEYVIRYADKWQAGMTAIYNTIHQDHSDFLRNFMLTNWKTPYVYDDENNCWIESTSSKSPTVIVKDSTGSVIYFPKVKSDPPDAS